MDALLIEADLAGNTIREMDVSALGVKMQTAGFYFIPGYFHHNFALLPNGHVILTQLTNFAGNFTDLSGYPGTVAVTGDGIVDLDQNWNPVWAWNSFDSLDVNRHLFGLPDWTQGNALVYPAAARVTYCYRGVIHPGFSRSTTTMAQVLQHSLEARLPRRLRYDSGGSINHWPKPRFRILWRCMSRQPCE